MKESIPVETEEAKREFRAMRLLAKDEEEKIVRKESKKFNRLFTSEVNWAIYNWVLTCVDFRSVSTVAEGMRMLYQHLWGYIKSYEETTQTLRNFIIDQKLEIENPLVKEALERDMPIAMSETALNKITKAARMRAKLRSYGVEVVNRGLVQNIEDI
jgi:hypothetical protein